MVRVGHYRGLTRIVSRVVVWWLSGARPTREGLPRGRVILDGHCDEIAVLAGRHRGDAECLGAESSRGRGFVGCGRGRLTVGVVTAVLERVGQVNVVLGQVRRMRAETVGDLGLGGQVHGLLSAGGRLGRPDVAVVDVGLQVALRQVGALASRHDAAHVEGTTQALLDALHRVCAAEHGEARAHLISFLLMKQSTVITEHMFAGDHSSI